MSDIRNGSTDDAHADRVSALADQLARFNEAYRRGTPMVSDSEYDRMVEALRELAAYHPFLQAVEPEEFGGKKKVRHPVSMLSTEKAYLQNDQPPEDLARYVARVERAAEEIGETDIVFKVTAKLDGLAGRDDGIQLVSRGDGRSGFDITNAFEKGVVPIGGRGRGLGEIVISLSYFKSHLADKFEHPRNLVVGIVTSDIVNEAAQNALDAGAVHFVPYDTLTPWEGSGESMVADIETIFASLLKHIDYPTDGLVAEVENVDIRRHMGATWHHYRWQIAVKMRGDTAITRVDAINWQVGRTGNLTPVMTVVPALLSGATIRRVTAHNAGMIERNRIGPGAEIEIIRSGEVIPKLERVVTPAGETLLPATCPSCGTDLLRQNDFLRCPNAQGCKDQLVQGIRYWFHVLGNADWFGVKTVERLVEAGFSSLGKVYAMTAVDFEALGFGPVQSKNLEAALQLSRTQEVEDWRFLAGFGISDLGVGDSRNLLGVLPLELILVANAQQIERIHGFGKLTSKSIAEGLSDRRKEIEEMFQRDFSLERTRPDAKDFIVATGILYGIDDLAGITQKERKTAKDKTATALAQQYTIEEIGRMDTESLSIVCDGNRSMAALIIERIPKAAGMLTKAARASVKWIYPPASTGDNDSGLAGKRVVFTGKMIHGTRANMEAIARKTGATVQSAVSRNTDFLVCGENVGASKLARAAQNDVKLLTEEEFMALMGAAAVPSAATSETR